MAATQEQVTALEKAINSGATEVTYNGRTVKYRSLDEMRRILLQAQEELAGTTPPRTTHAVFSKD